jgi:hypothetical protein
MSKKNACLPHLFYCYVTSLRMLKLRAPMATAVSVTYSDTSSIVACGRYLATADVYRATSQQQVDTSQYSYGGFSTKILNVNLVSYTLCNSQFSTYLTALTIQGDITWLSQLHAYFLRRKPRL